MKELTVHEVQAVSGAWNFGYGAFWGGFIGGGIGARFGAERAGVFVGSHIGSIFDNIDYYQMGENYKEWVFEEISNGNYPPD